MDSSTMSSLHQEEEEPPPDLASILVMYSVVETPQCGEARDILTDLETLETAHSIADGLGVLGCGVTTAPVRCEQDIPQAVEGLDPRTTLIFNLCETLGGKSSDESTVPRWLDRLGFSYSGAAANTLDDCLDKSRTKARLSKLGVPTASYQVFHHPQEPVSVPLPAIVKPVAEDCSLGITRDSVVWDEPALRRQVAYILDTYRQPALTEMFLDGREFNVGVWGNGTTHVLPIAEIDFSAWPEHDLRVVNFDAKWNEDSREYWSMPVLCPAPIPAALARRIRRTALAAYQAMGCRDYARVDMREKDGIPYVLEVNPNPCLATDGGFANAARVAGYDYPHMAGQIATWAWWRSWHAHEIA